MTSPMHNNLVHRTEDASRPRLGDLIGPGQVFQITGGDDCRCRVEAVKAHEYEPGRVAWSVVFRWIDRPGPIMWLNDLVAVWEADAPRFLPAPLNMPHEIILRDDVVWREARSGQLDLF